MWQEIVVAVFVLAAAAFWLRKLPIFKKKSTTASACGGCNNCSSNSSGGCH